MASYLVEQGYALVNDAFNATIGDMENVLDTIDTTDVVTMGKTLSNFDLVDKFYGELTNRIAKTVCCALNYNAKTRQILKDSISWGGFIQKIYVNGPSAVETQSYNVENGSADASPYDIEDAMTIKVKVFGGSTTWSLEFKNPTVQLRKCFLGDAEMMAFIDSLFVQAQSTAELEKESVVNIAVSTGMAYAWLKGNFVNPLDLYNEQFGKSLTSKDCDYDADYVKFANMIINKEVRLLGRPSKNNTPDKYLNYSNRDSIVLEVSADFDEKSRVYLESGTYHDDKVKIAGNYDAIDFWLANSEGSREFIEIRNEEFEEVEDADYYVSIGKAIGFARDKDYVACHFENNYSWSLPNPRARTHYYGYDFERGYAVDGCQSAKLFVESSHLPFDDSVKVESLGAGKYNIIPVAPSGKVVDKVYYGPLSMGEPSVNTIDVDLEGNYLLDIIPSGVDEDMVFKATFKNA